MTRNHVLIKRVRDSSPAFRCPTAGVLADHSALAASPLTALAVRIAARTREAAMEVARAHSLGVPDFFAMTCVVSAHVLCVRSLGSGVERLLISVLAPHL